MRLELGTPGSEVRLFRLSWTIALGSIIPETLTIGTPVNQELMNLNRTFRITILTLKTSG